MHVMRDVTAALSAWLAAGGEEIGQVRIRAGAAGFALCHRDDAGRTDLELFTGADAARALANLDAAGKFRPLKTTRDLRRGWRLNVADARELRRALDFFYPAMTGVWLSRQRGELRPVPLRETLDRQTGMYAITKKITDPQARGMIDSFCAPCLKHRLWDIASANAHAPAFPPHALPLLCHEACNLLVARAREIVKQTATP
jgi:sirohydrochlorin cobaltochelatase